MLMQLHEKIDFTGQVLQIFISNGIGLIIRRDQRLPNQHQQILILIYLAVFYLVMQVCC